jgi:hypothetical protein
MQLGSQMGPNIESSPVETFQYVSGLLEVEGGCLNDRVLLDQ